MRRANLPAAHQHPEDILPDMKDGSESTRSHSHEVPEVVLCPDETGAALHLAQRTYERNRDRADFSYANKLETHQVGKLGEVGAEAWLRSHNIGVQPVFRDIDRENECDLLTDRFRIEVKTWSRRFWEPWGRCITPKQLPWITKKADLILWTTADHSDSRGAIRIRGWNTPDEVGTFPPCNTGPDWKPVFNHQVPIDRVRDPATFLTILKERP